MPYIYLLIFYLILHIDHKTLFLQNSIHLVYKFPSHIIFFEKEHELGSTKSQRQIKTANPDARNKNNTISAFLPCQKHISLFPIAHYIFLHLSY